MALQTIPTSEWASLRLSAGQVLRLIDPQGGGSGDLMAFRAGDITEWMSSRPLFTIVRDDVGRHDFLYTACSIEMYRIQYGITGDHPNCLDNLCAALASLGVRRHQLPTPFNFFMNASVTPEGLQRRNAEADRLRDPGLASHLTGEAH